MTKEEKQEFDDLYYYVKNEVMGYTDKVFPTNFVLRLKGLAEGNFVANKSMTVKAKYSFKVILLTFKLCKAKINDYLSRNASSFQSEQHKFYGVMRIVEGEINNTVAMLDRRVKSEAKVEVMDVEHHSAEQAEYTTKGKVKNKFKELL
jgi:hypothetical protein